MTLQAASVLGAAIIIAAFLMGGRFSPIAVTRGNETGYVLITDRYTGSARFCFPNGCRDLGEQGATPTQRQVINGSGNLNFTFGAAYEPCAC
jgi:hypothetical protein